MKTGFICASGYNLVATRAPRRRARSSPSSSAQYGGKSRTEHAAELLDEGFDAPLPAEGETYTTLSDVTSGESYDEPFDMKPYVCGAKRVTVASEDNPTRKKTTAGPSRI